MSKRILNNFLTKLNCLDTGRFYLESQITDEEAKELVELTIARLQEVETPSLSKCSRLRNAQSNHFELSFRYGEIADRL